MTHPDAHRFDSDHDFQDHIHGADKPMPYFDSDPVLANELAWDKLHKEMMAVSFMFAAHDYNAICLKSFRQQCSPLYWNQHSGCMEEAFSDGIIDTLPIIEILSMEDDGAVPQPLRAVCHWFHDKLLTVWEEYHK